MAAGHWPVDAARCPVVLVAGEADLLADLAHSLDAKPGEVEAHQREVARWIGVVVQIEGLGFWRAAILLWWISRTKVHMHLHVRRHDRHCAICRCRTHQSLREIEGFCASLI